MSKNKRFTSTELIASAVFLIAVGAVLFYGQRAGLQASHRDTIRKTAVNTLYYSLVEEVKPSLGGYPRVLKSDQLKTMDAAMLTDPRGHKINTQDSEYRYEPTDCNGGDLCQSFILRAELEREDTFVKTSPL